jgi:D-alanyl-D-alanine carboxypeptidase
MFAFLFAFIALQAPVFASGDDARLSASLHNVLGDYLTSRGRIEHISAASLSVSFHGDPKNLDVAAGMTSYGGTVPVTPATLFQIGSNTKAFTAAALLQLEAEGKLSIDSTVGLWLPQYPAWKAVTIRHLLDMTSPIPTYDDTPAMQRGESSIHRRWTAPQLVAFVDPVYGHAPPPTTGWSYSNTNYLLAQMIIERASGASYTSEIRRRFIEPLGLTSTYYSPDTYPVSVTDRMASGYFASSDPGNASLSQLFGLDMRLADMSWAQGAGGIVSTPDDLTHWVRALYQGDMLAAAQRKELLRVVSDGTGEPIGSATAQHPKGFGLGVGELYKPGLGTFWYYEGETLGYRMLYAYFPKNDLVIAVGLNSQPNAKEDHIGELMFMVYETLHKAGRV